MIPTLLWAATLVATTPDRVLVVVNEESPLSLRIAESYVQRRGIPARHVCRIRTTTTETVDRARYTKEIEAAITAHLKRERLDQIHYLVLTQGVPLRIAAETNGPWTETDGASVDSELTLLYARQRGARIPWRGTFSNPFFRQREAPFNPKTFGMYLVTRLAAYDYAGVDRMIGRSLAALDPASNRHGKFVLDLRSGDDRDGDNWLKTAAILLPAERLIVDETTMVITKVKDALGYAGWGSNDSNRKIRWLDFHWLPGALATEFVSTDGRTFEKPPASWKFGTWNSPATWFKGSPQAMTADYIEEGATGASGHVDEPYLQFTPRPDILFPAYLAGRNLAEAYWMSIPALSWMNIVVGDPLCRLSPALSPSRGQSPRNGP